MDMGRLIGSGGCCPLWFGSGCGSGEQFGDSDEVVGGDGEGEDSVHAGFAADFDGCEARCRLDPAEDLFDAFAAALADGIAGVAGCRLVDGSLSDLAQFGHGAVDRDMRGDATGAQVAHEVGHVIGLVRAEGDRGRG